MIDETLNKIEAKLQSADSVKDIRKDELLRLLSTLRAEITKLSQTDADQARSIAGYTELSAHEATREEPNPRLLKHSVAGLQSAVEGFEKSHPRLVEVVNSISQTLSNLGI